MNTDQWMPFALFMQQSRNRKEDRYVPIHCIINGVAGAGKSWIVRHIIRDIKLVNSEMDDNIFTSKRVLLCAHQGIAAFNIKGRTLFDAFRLDVKTFYSKYQPLNCDDSRRVEKLKELQRDLSEVQLVVIDEHSMISAEMLYHLDMRMREIFYTDSTVPFGGRDMIFMGDFKQLPPVLSSSLAKPSETPSHQGKGLIVQQGHQIWQNIKYVFTLSKNQRASSDIVWARLLQQIRDGKCNDTHLSQLRSSFVRDPNILFADPRCRQAKVICKTNARVDYYNDRFIQNQTNPIITIIAKHHISSKSITLTHELAMNLIQTEVMVNKPHSNTLARLRVAVGCPVRISRNLCTAAGLCNGTPGTIIDIWYDPLRNNQPAFQCTSMTEAMQATCDQPLPVILIQVEADFYSGPSFLKDIPRVVPILPVNCTYSLHGGINVTRTIHPLQLNYAMTIYKVQGLTLDKLIFDTEKVQHGTEIYVALSRVRNQCDVAICGNELNLKQLNEFWASRGVA